MQRPYDGPERRETTCGDAHQHIVVSLQAGNDRFDRIESCLDRIEDRVTQSCNAICGTIDGKDLGMRSELKALATRVDYLERARVERRRTGIELLHAIIPALLTGLVSAALAIAGWIKVHPHP